MRKMVVSALRHRLMLQQEVRTEDDAGGFVRSWQDVVALWAEIVPVDGREVVMGGQIEGRVTHRIRLRYRAGVDSGMRLLFGERVFHIRAVMCPMERGEWLDVLAEEGLAAV